MNIGGKLTQCECYCGCKAVASVQLCKQEVSHMVKSITALAILMFAILGLAYISGGGF